MRIPTTVECGMATPRRARFRDGTAHRLMGIALAACFLALPARAEIGVQNSGGGVAGSANVTAYTQSATVSSGENKILVVAVQWRGSDTASVTSLTYGGTALTLVSGSSVINSSGNRVRTMIFYLVDPPEVTANLTASFSAAIWRAAMTRVVLTGAKQQAPEAVATAAGNGVSTLNATITTLTRGAMVVSAATLSHYDLWPMGQLVARSLNVDHTRVGASIATHRAGEPGAVATMWRSDRSEGFSQSVVAFASAEACTLPLPPSDAAAAPTSSSTASVSWTDNADNETGFRLQRRPLWDRHVWVDVATLPANTTVYADSGLAANTDYHYRVLAFNEGGEGGFSGESVAAKTFLRGPEKVDQANPAIWYATGSFSVSYTVPVGPNRIVVVGFGTRGHTPAAVTYGGQQLTRIDARSNAGTTIRTELYYLLDPPAGTTTLSATFGDSNMRNLMSAVTLLNAKQEGPEAWVGAAYGDTSVTTMNRTITPLTAYGMVVDMLYHGANARLLATEPIIRRTHRMTDADWFNRGAMGTREIGDTPGQVTQSWTASSGARCAHSVAIFAPAQPPATLITVR